MHIVLGLSGGPDSVCLFNVLLELASDMNLTIHPVHVNHKFRPGAAEADQEYAEQLCAARGLKCRTVVTDCNELAARLKLTPEEAGRKARYDAFFALAENLADSGIAREDIAVAVAQNANDQCETILFRILRGTGTEGLSGIAYKRAGEGGISVIRPLLDVTRTEIENYCEACNLQPRIDHTNNETIYTRNKIRLELIPYLAENFNGNIIETINRLGSIAADDADFLRSAAAAAYQVAACTEAEEGTEALFTASLDNVHKAVRFRVYSIALGKIGLRENVTSAHFEAIEGVRLSSNPSAQTSLTGGYRVSKIYDKLLFYKEDYAGDPCRGWQLVTMTRAEYAEYAANGPLHGAFSAAAIGALANPDNLEVRTRRDGDYLIIPGGRKKLQDFFVDCKVPKLHRDRIPVLALGSTVIWVMPSEYFCGQQNQKYREKGRFSAGFRAGLEQDDTIIVLEQK